MPGHPSELFDIQLRPRQGILCLSSVGDRAHDTEEPVEAGDHPSLRAAAATGDGQRVLDADGLPHAQRLLGSPESAPGRYEEQNRDRLKQAEHENPPRSRVEERGIHEDLITR